MGVVLVIAGSDSSCGAGIAADLRTLGAFRCQPRIALTAVTAQGPRGVTDTHLVPVNSTEAQIDAARLAGVDAIKIGMLASEAHVAMVVSLLRNWPSPPPVVLDPVLRASSGARLLTPAGEALLRAELLPLVTIATPNSVEAKALAAPMQAAKWASNYPAAILITGGDIRGDTVTDTLFTPGNTEVLFSANRTPGISPRGTGCALATAIAAGLSNNVPLAVAVQTAIEYVQRRISHMDGP